MGALARDAGLDAARPRRAALDDALGRPSRSRRARARSTTSRGSTADDVAPLGRGRVRRGAAARRRVPRRRARAPARALRDAGAILVLATDLNPGTSPIVSLPLVDRPRRCASTGWHARGARRDDAQRRLGARPSTASWARSSVGQARRPGAARQPGRADRLPLRTQPGGGRVHRRPPGPRARRRARGGSRSPMTVTIPAMVNAHSHAFQIDLRGAAERPGARRTAPTTSGAGAPRCSASPPRTIPTRCATPARACLRADGARRLRRRRRVPLRPPPARRHALRRAQRDGARAGRRGAIEAGLEIVLLAAAYHRAGWPRRRPATESRASGASATPTSERSSSASTRCARWARRAARRARRRRRAQRPRGAGELDRGDRRLREPPRPGPPRPRLRAAPRARRVRRRARLHADRAARAHRLPRARRERRPRRSTSDERDIALLAAQRHDRRSAAPRPRATSATAILPALRYRDAGVPIAIGTDSQVRIDPFEEARELETGARREGLTRHGLLARDRRPLGRPRRRGAREPRPAGRARRDRDRPDAPRPCRRRAPRPSLCARDRRLVRDRHARRLRAPGRASGVGELSIHDHHGSRPLAAAQSIERLLHPVEVGRVRDHVGERQLAGLDEARQPRQLVGDVRRAVVAALASTSPKGTRSRAARPRRRPGRGRRRPPSRRSAGRPRRGASSQDARRPRRRDRRRLRRARGPSAPCARPPPPRRRPSRRARAPARASRRHGRSRRSARHPRAWPRRRPGARRRRSRSPRRCRRGARRAALRTAPAPVTTPQPSSDACHSGMSASSGTAPARRHHASARRSTPSSARAGGSPPAPSRSREVPSISVPRTALAPAGSQRLRRPARQERHCPHDGTKENATRSPGATWVTRSPTDSTTPAPSCPSTIGQRPSPSASVGEVHVGVAHAGGGHRARAPRRPSAGRARPPRPRRACRARAARRRGSSSDPPLLERVEVGHDAEPGPARAAR